MRRSTHFEVKVNKVKVKFTLEQAKKGQRGSSFLTLALNGVGGQRHAPAALPSGKISGTDFTGGWVGSRAGLDERGKSRRHRDSIPGPATP